MFFTNKKHSHQFKLLTARNNRIFENEGDKIPVRTTTDITYICDICGELKQQTVSGNIAKEITDKLKDFAPDSSEVDKMFDKLHKEMKEK